MKILEPSKEALVFANVDIVVCGEGREGWPAAIAAFPKKVFSTPLPFGIGLNIFDPPAEHLDALSRVNEVRVWGVHVTNVDATDPVQLRA